MLKTMKGLNENTRRQVVGSGTCITKKERQVVVNRNYRVSGGGRKKSSGWRKIVYQPREIAVSVEVNQREGGPGRFAGEDD